MCSMRTTRLSTRSSIINTRKQSTHRALPAGETIGKYVPQAVRDVEGTLLDIDSILNACFPDGCQLYVQYSSGPLAFQARCTSQPPSRVRVVTIRWADRPRTPPFQWGLHGEEIPQHDAWLTEMDFTIEPLVTDALPSIVQMDAETAASYNAEDDCRALHQTVIAAAGAIQAAFLCLQSSTHGRDSDKRDRLSTAQFRSFIHVFISPFFHQGSALTPLLSSRYLPRSQRRRAMTCSTLLQRMCHRRSSKRRTVRPWTSRTSCLLSFAYHRTGRTSTW